MTVPYAASHPDGTILAMWVVPGASRSEVVGPHGDALRVRIAAPPERGRANRALLELVGGICDRPVELLSGAGTRRKRVLVRGLSPERVRELLRPDR